MLLSAGVRFFYQLRWLTRTYEFTDADWTMFGCFWTNGQMCSATSRLIVHEQIAAKFLQKLVDWVKKVKVSDPLEEGCRLDPVVSGGHYEKIMKFISVAKSEGATILCGGRRPQHLKRGLFIEPTIIINVDTSMQIWRGVWTCFVC